MRNKIVVGGHTFSELKSANLFLSNSISHEELSVDTLTSVADCSATGRTIFRPRGSAGMMTADRLLFTVRPRFLVLAVDPTGFSYGQRVEYYRDETLFAVFYLSNVQRVGKFLYKLSCVSAVGMLDGDFHPGGLYTGQLMPAVLAEIVGDKISYTLDPVFATTRVYGWLPYASRRANLHQLLFAMGAGIRKDLSGSLYITTLDASAPADIAGDRIYNDGTVNYQARVTGIQVTEHAYFAYPGDEETTLFDNTSAGAVDRQLVTFDAPCHDLTVSGGLIINKRGVNYAVLTGAGILTGKKYTHQTSVLEKSDKQAKGEPNVLAVKEATLVNFLNSENVAARLMSYYASAYDVRVGLVAGAERPGDPVCYRDPFDEVRTGLIKSLDINVSNTLKADATITSGYAPAGGSGNLYEHRALLTGNGTWTVPDGVEHIRVVLIGGGSGGGNGSSGGCKQAITRHVQNSIRHTLANAGDTATVSATASTTSDDAGKGGAGGAGGAGGKVSDLRIEVAPGASFSYSCGAGGAAGSSGGDTRFGAHSSANGSYLAVGFVDAITGALYASPGSAGASGGDGGGSGQTGGSVGVVSGGFGIPAKKYTKKASYSSAEERMDVDVSVSCSAAGGGGAGGSSGAVKGSPGGSASYGQDGKATTSYPSTGHGYGHASDYGSGGKGADGAAGNSPGAGGAGGGGGGGAGAYGTVSVTTKLTVTRKITDTASNRDFFANAWANVRTYYAGGTGGRGGNGAPGCVIVYY